MSGSRGRLGGVSEEGQIATKPLCRWPDVENGYIMSRNYYLGFWLAFCHFMAVFNDSLHTNLLQLQRVINNNSIGFLSSNTFVVFILHWSLPYHTQTLYSFSYITWTAFFSQVIFSTSFFFSWNVQLQMLTLETHHHNVQLQMLTLEAQHHITNADFIMFIADADLQNGCPPMM